MEIIVTLLELGKVGLLPNHFVKLCLVLVCLRNKNEKAMKWPGIQIDYIGYWLFLIACQLLWVI